MKIISHVVQLLGEWAELFPYDFRDERMMAHVRSITQKCIAVNPTVSPQSCCSIFNMADEFSDTTRRVTTPDLLAFQTDLPGEVRKLPAAD